MTNNEIGNLAERQRPRCSRQTVIEGNAKMTIARKTGMVAIALGIGLTALSNAAVKAHELVFGTLKIQHPWVALTDAKTGDTTGYVIEIQNNGKEPDRLVGASVNGVPGILRESSRDSTGRPFVDVTQGLEVKAGGFLRIQPGEKQILFRELKAPLKEGEMVKGTLIFEKAGTLQIEFMVEPASLAEDDRSAPPKMGHMHH
jgi:periplasmic copper chaperone A